MVDGGGCRGFTLVEMLVALLIAAVCFSVILNIMVHSKIHQGQAWEMTRASFAAAAVAEEIKGLSYADVTAVPRTPYPRDQSLEYAVAVGPAGYESMKTISVTVFYVWGGDEKSICLRMEKLNR